MRLLVLVVLFFMSATLARAEEDPNHLYMITMRGGLTMTKFVKPEYAEGLRAIRPDVVSLNWESGTDDLADPVSQQQVDGINGAIATVLEANKDVVLALTSIAVQRRGVWALYAPDGRTLSSSLSAILAGKTRVPVRLKSGSDPEWNAVSNYVAKLQAEK